MSFLDRELTFQATYFGPDSFTPAYTDREVQLARAQARALHAALSHVGYEEAKRRLSARLKMPGLSPAFRELLERTVFGIAEWEYEEERDCGLL